MKTSNSELCPDLATANESWDLLWKSWKISTLFSLKASLDTDSMYMDCSGNFNFNFVSIPFGYAVVIIEPQIFYVEDGCVKSNYSDDEHLIEDHFSS